MYRHYQTPIDYKKLIELQASNQAPFTGKNEVKKGNKEVNKVSSAKVKTLGVRRTAK